MKTVLFINLAYVQTVFFIVVRAALLLLSFCCVALFNGLFAIVHYAEMHPFFDLINYMALYVRLLIDLVLI